MIANGKKKDLEDKENNIEQVDGSMSDTFILLRDVSWEGRIRPHAPLKKYFMWAHQSLQKLCMGLGGAQ